MQTKLKLGIVTQPSTTNESAPRLTWGARIAIYGIVGMLALLVSIPFFWMLVTSLKEAQYAFDFRQILPPEAQWQNYRAAWERAPFARYFFNSTFVAVAVLCLQFLTIIPASYAFSRLSFPGRNLLFFLILATMMVPAQVTFIPSYVLLSRLEWRDTYPGLILPFATSAFGIFLLRQAFTQVPQDYLDAARLDGCTHLGVIRHVMLPLSMPTLITFGLFSFVSRYNDLFWPLIVTDSPQMRTIPVGLVSFIEFEMGTRWNELMAASTFSMLPLIILFLLTQRFFIKGIANGGLKG